MVSCKFPLNQSNHGKMWKDLLVGAKRRVAGWVAGWVAGMKKLIVDLWIIPENSLRLVTHQ